MNRILFYDKLKFTVYHFLFSLILILITGYIIFFVWYPNPFYQLFAVFDVFLLLLLIDLILGPLCTFIIYNKQKKSLKMDIAIILLVQMMAFSWGVWSIAQARPAWLVLFYDTFYVVSPSLLQDEKGNSIKMPITEQNWGKPKITMLKPDIDVLAISGMDYGAVQLQPDNFIAYSNEQALIKKLPLINVENHDRELYKYIIENHPQAVGYFPIIAESSMKMSIALLNKQGEVEKVILAE